LIFVSCFESLLSASYLHTLLNSIFSIDSDAPCSRSPGRRYLVDVIENEVENVALSAVRHGFRDQVNQKDHKGQTPLCAAVERNVYSMRLIEELITGI
jgi:hypothetical protein